VGKTYETTIKLGAELARDFGAVLGGAEKRLAALGKSVADMEKAAGAAKSFDRLGTEVAEAEKKVAETRAEVVRLDAAMQAAEKPSAELTAAFKAAKKAAAEAERALTRKSKALERAGDKLKTAGVDSKKLAEEQRRLAASIKRTELRMAGLSQIAGAKLGPSLKKLGGELKTVALAGAALAAGALWKMQDAAVGVDTAMAELATQDATKEQIQALH